MTKETIENLERLQQDLEFQLGFAETAKADNISISKEQGYTCLAMVQLLLDKAEKRKSN